MTTSPEAPFLIPVAAYFLGSVPFGVLFARLFGSGDIRKSGSGNIGATNVARVAGLAAGILTLVFDATKGAAAVLLAERLASHRAAWLMIAAVSALIGHCFPIWLEFKGGKGVATAAGVFAVLAPLALAADAIVFLAVVFKWRFISLGSLCAAAAMPLFVYFLWAPGYAPPLAVTFGTLAIALLIIYKHDANIQRLVQREEPKFSFRKDKDAA